MKSVKVAVTGAAGQIGYAILFRIASGQMFGPETEVHLSLLELPQALDALNGVKMELDDCALPLLRSATCTSDMNIAFSGVDWSLLIGSVPRKAGMERNDLLKINGGIFVGQGKAIAQNAKPDSKVLVVGNPCNTNAWTAKAVCNGKIPERNFFAMTMLDQNRAVAQIAQKANVSVRDIDRLAIWGNHSSTQFPNFCQSTIGGKTAEEIISDRKWFENDFMATVQKRGAAIIAARGASSAASAANAAVDTVRNLTSPTKAGSYFSVAVSSDGSYGVPKGLMFSYPIRTNGSDWEIVQDIKLSSYEQDKIKVTTQELEEEKAAVQGLM